MAVAFFKKIPLSLRQTRRDNCRSMWLIWGFKPIDSRDSESRPWLHKARPAASTSSGSNPQLFLLVQDWASYGPQQCVCMIIRTCDVTSVMLEWRLPPEENCFDDVPESEEMFQNKDETRLTIH
jgi:hypothetical protein